MMRARSPVAVLVIVVALITGAAPPALGATTMPVARFEPPILPEGLTVTSDGTAYVGIATKGEIRRVTPSGDTSTIATLRPGLGSLLGLTLDSQGNVVAALA
jgi:hypothetical protein